MSFRVVLETGAVIEIEGNSAIIGRDPSCAIALPDDDRIETQHAIIKRFHGRWMVESQGEHLLHVGDSAPGRVHWIRPGDQIRLSEPGPVLVFDPASAGRPPAAPAPPPQREAESSPAQTPVPSSDPVQEHAVSVVEYHRVESKQPAPADPAPSSEQALPAQPATNPAAWAVGGGIAAILTVCVTVGLLWATGAFKSGQQPAAHVPPPETVAITVAESAEQGSPPDETPPKTAEPAEKFDVKRTLYSIVLKTSEGHTFQLGTAFAVSNHNLVTTASVIKEMQKLKASQLKMKAFAISPVTKRKYDLSDTKTAMHPEFARTVQRLQTAKTKMDELDQQLKQATDEKSAELIIQELTEQAEERYQILEHRFFHDIGVIELNDELADYLQVNLKDMHPAIGTTILLAGIPVEQDKVMLDPNAPPGPMESKGQILALNASPADSNVKRLIIKCERDISGFYFPGSPVLNAAHEVIGIYARPTPPPFQPNPTASAITTHDLTSISQLKETGLKIP